MADIQEIIKLISLDKLTLYDSLIKAYVDGKIFIGTKAEYETSYANGEILVGCLVCITDDLNSSSGGSSGGSSSGDNSSTSTSSLLGTGALGYMILG